jgi:hypothetical protein
MAKLITEVLGGAGILPEQPDKTGVLPSPDKLKNKVLLKGKMVNFKDEEDEEAQEKEEKDKKGKKDSKAEVKPEATAKELSELIHLKAVGFKNFAHSKGIFNNDIKF